MKKIDRAKHFLNIISDAMSPVEQDAVILDFGCGGGELVSAFNHLGYTAFGCDVKLNEETGAADSDKNELIREIQLHPYRLPFEDNTFDVVVSDQVFEHVQDYPAALSEIKRILKPGGMGVHVFPSRYKFIEPHAYVPLATVFRSYWWLQVWALLGIRNSYQKGVSSTEAATRNFNYLRDHTNYLKKSEIREYVESYFPNYGFAEKYFLKYGNRGRYIYNISRIFPLVSNVYSTLRSRVLVIKSD